jgi:hypothetical protein
MFSNLKSLTIPEGDVTKIESGGVVLWEKPASYKNWIKYAETANNANIYNNGLGYQNNQAINKAGNVVLSTKYNSVTTGWMPFKITDVIRIKGVRWIDANVLNSAVEYFFALYKPDKTVPSYDYVINSKDVYNGNADVLSQFSAVYDEKTGVTTFSFPDPTATTGAIRLAAQKAAWFRFNAYNSGENLIVTINEEIK